MSRLADALRRIGGALGRRQVRFAVVGGIAVSARVEPRFTQDLDLCVDVPDDAAAERLVSGLRSEGWRVLAQVEHESMRRLATVRLRQPDSAEGDVVVDLLFASSGIEAEVVAGAEPLELFGRTRAPVAGVAHLLALKVLARDDVRRPQDRVDLVRLLAGARAIDVEEARAALRLVAERGFDRGRDLLAALARLEREGSDPGPP